MRKWAALYKTGVRQGRRVAGWAAAAAGKQQRRGDCGEGQLEWAADSELSAVTLRVIRGRFASYPAGVERLGRAPTTISAYLDDPDDAKAKQRPCVSGRPQRPSRSAGWCSCHCRPLSVDLGTGAFVSVLGGSATGMAGFGSRRRLFEHRQCTTCSGSWCEREGPVLPEAGYWRCGLAAVSMSRTIE
jgi:hypothetical protein